MALDTKNLGLLMTRGMSLSKWERVGNLERELKPYVELSKTFKKIFIFTYGGPGDLRYQQALPKNIKIISKPVLIPSFLYMFLMPFIHARTFRRIDIIKTNQMDSSLPGVIAKGVFGKKLVVRCGFELLDFLIRGRRSWVKILYASTIEKLAYRCADKIIITSKSDKEFVEQRFNINPNVIAVIPNYIDTEKFKPSDVPEEASRLVFVGRFEYQKNLLNLVKAMQGLSGYLVMVGSGSQQEDLKQLAVHLGVMVKFIGNKSQSEVVQELQKSEVFILPSLYEGNPKALLEAMACGLPCIGTNVKGIREVISSGENGILVEPSSESLRSTILSLLENPELRDRLGRNAREEIVRNYSLEVVLKKEKEIYENLV